MKRNPEKKSNRDRLDKPELNRNQDNEGHGSGLAGALGALAAAGMVLVCGKLFDRFFYRKR